MPPVTITLMLLKGSCMVTQNRNITSINSRLREKLTQKLFLISYIFIVSQISLD